MNQIVMNMGTGGTQTTRYAIQSAAILASKAEIDQLFDTLMQLSNFAHDSGLEQVAEHLEDALDCLIEA